LALGFAACLTLSAALCLSGCLGSGDGNPPRGSISVPRAKDGARKRGLDYGEDGSGAKAKTKAGGGRPGGKAGGL
jgi:hypothetical protein